MRLVAAAFFVVSSLCAAQTYPTRPVTMIVPFAPGGPTDTLARIVAEPMKTSLGQPVVIENVTGAGGSIAVVRAARAAPDGYTVILGNWNTHVGVGAIFPIQYDVLRDFEPISLLPFSYLWLVGHSSVPAKDPAELVAWLKANPGKASAATIGTGSAAHLCTVHFQNQTATRFQLVPYKSGAQAYQDLVAGHVNLMCAETSATVQYVRGGKIKAYAVMAPKRWSSAPEVPTVDETGLPGLHIAFWHGLWAPKGTSPEVVGRLNRAVVDALADPASRQRLSDIGQEIPPREQQAPRPLRDYQKAEIDKWWPLIKAAGIKAEQ